MGNCHDAEHGHECIACCFGGRVWVEDDIRVGPVDTGVEVDIHCAEAKLIVSIDGSSWYNRRNCQAFMRRPAYFYTKLKRPIP